MRRGEIKDIERSKFNCVVLHKAIEAGRYRTRLQIGHDQQNRWPPWLCGKAFPNRPPTQTCQIVALSGGLPTGPATAKALPQSYGERTPDRAQASPA
jgi:hypothetical protein